MKIALDAHLLFRSPDGGGRVQRCLNEALLAEPAPHRYVLLVDERARGRPIPDGLSRGEPLYLDYRVPLLTHVALLRKKARALGIDLVCLQYFAPWAAPPARVVVVHDNLFDSHPEFFSLVERAYLRFVKPCARRAERVVTGSEFSRREIVRWGLADPERVAVVPYGVDPRFLVARPDEGRLTRLRLDLRLPERFLLYVGRLNVRKNLAALVEAFGRVAARHPVGLVLAGKAEWKRDDLDTLVSRLGIGSRVVRLGHVPDEDLPALYAAAEAFVYVPLAEGFGLPVVEAMACGTPVVCSSGTALEEVAGGACLPVDPADTGAIASALERIVSDAELRERCRRTGLARAGELTWAQAARKLLGIFEEAADPRARRG